MITSNINKTITTTLPLQIHKDLDLASKELNLPKNDIIARSFALWNKQRKQEELAASCARMSEAERAALISGGDEGINEWEERIASME